jgi:hypothetical protein
MNAPALTAITAFASALAVGFGAASAGEGASTGAWTSLFNGKDLSGWETYLAALPGESRPLGRDRDPLKVFQVVEIDGEPAIRISGEVLGGLATLAAYENYHLQLEFKWGERRFAPRADLPRDSGLLYHGSGGYNPDTGWMESLELGILEGGETGDFWSVPGEHGARVVVDVEGDEIPPEKRRYGDQPIRHRRGGKTFAGTRSGILNSDDNEKPRGQWNTLDLACVGQRSLHLVNGTLNMALSGARRRVDGAEEPLTRGRLQLQSEGAEVFFRRLRLRPIEAFPDEHELALREAPHNTLSEAERAAGWRLLFDGRSLAGWRAYRAEKAPEGWKALEGVLTRAAKAGDLITEERFGDFELVFDWKISHGGNSGVFYRLTEDGSAPYETGPEYEIRDNAFWRDDPYTSAANYGLHAPSRDASRPVGYWNRGRISVSKNRVEHWLNGERVVLYELGSADWKRLLEASKFGRWPGYGASPRGAIGLQDHGDPVGFRNLKIRPLP